MGRLPKRLCAGRICRYQAALDPAAIAIESETGAWRYDELDARSNQLAHRLRRLGVEPGVTVGICLERSFEMAVALLGVLKAGGAYVPLDPDGADRSITFHAPRHRHDDRGHAHW